MSREVGQSRVLIDLLAHLGPELDRVWAVTADLAGPARLNVSWAGSDTSPAWLDIAREYTEFWVHQQQIRDAVSWQGADEVALMRPVLVTFLHAVPWGPPGVDASLVQHEDLRQPGQSGPLPLLASVMPSTATAIR
ncbi:hypothetical protein [Nocardia grenadensis]